MIRTVLTFLLLLPATLSFSQDFIALHRYHDSAAGFSIDIPDWRLIPQGKGSSLKLYAYDSSSAIACTAQTYLEVRYAKTNTQNLRALLASEMQLRGGKNHIRIQDTGHVGNIPYLISQDSVVCRPGEIEEYVTKHFAVFVYYRKPYKVTLLATAAELDVFLADFKKIAASMRFE